VPAVAISAVPVPPTSLIEKSISILHLLSLVIPGIDITPVSAKTTSPALTVISSVLLFSAFTTPEKVAWYASPLVKPLAGIDSVPTPPPIKLPET
jgi:hypothetical protein